MKRTVIFLTLIFVLCGFLSNVAFSDEEFLIGVLAKRGPEKCLKKWEPLAKYLTEKIPGKSFEIVPLSFNAVSPAIDNVEVDFFLVNPSMFMTAKVKYNASAVVTMINARQGQELKSFGGVIITKADNEQINTLIDIIGNKIMGVKASAFGGWQVAYKEIMDAGIDPFADCASIEWGANHDKVVYAVRDGKADVGTVRTDTLERMADEGSIKLSEFKIINKKEHQGFPFVCSTVLYPEWPFAKVESVSDDVAKEVAGVLLEMESSDKAAKAAKIMGWTEVLDYEVIETLQKSLKVGAYKE